MRLGHGRIQLEYVLPSRMNCLGSLRLGHITLISDAFDPKTLLYASHHGGYSEEKFHLAGKEVDHGSPVSFLVSASHSLAVTNGSVRIGDAQRSLLIGVDKKSAAVIAYITFHNIGSKYFFRVTYSAREMDDTRCAWKEQFAPEDFSFCFSISPYLNECQC